MNFNMPTAMEGTTPIFVTEIELPKTRLKKLGDALVANKNVHRPTACIFHGHIRGQNVCFGRRRIQGAPSDIHPRVFLTVKICYLSFI